jgi:hypothetical protein
MKRYSAKELAIGTEVELEHTSDRAIARRIAKDHLDEDPKYYSHLAECGMLHNPTLAPQKENGVRAIFWEDRWVPLKKNQYHEDFAAELGRSLPSLFRDGAITQWDGIFNLNKLTKRTQRIIADRLIDVPVIGIDRIEIYTNSAEPHEERYYGTVPLEQAMTADYPIHGPEQAMTPNGWNEYSFGHYVWVVDSKSMPVIGEGPYGPFSLDKPEAFARIGAQHGARGRVVSKGLDPESRSFDVVRVYLPSKR